MSKTIPITQFGYRTLRQKQKELSRIVKRPGRPSKSLADSLKVYKEQLEEIDQLLENSVVTEFSEKEPAYVQIGSKVTTERLSTGDNQEYTIMSRAVADPTVGVISNESPLAQRMMGLKLGNTFKFRNYDGREETFKIINIE